MDALRWTRMSCHDFDDNQVRLQLFVLAYNLGNFLRRIALPVSVKHWTYGTHKKDRFDSICWAVAGSGRIIAVD